MNKNDTMQKVSGPIDATVIRLNNDGTASVRDLVMNDDIAVSFDDDTELLEMTFDQKGTKIVSERRMELNEVREGDKLVLFLEEKTDRVVKALRAVDKEHRIENLKNDPFAQRTRAIGLDHIELLSLSRGYKPLIFDVVRKDKEIEFSKMMDEMSISYRFIDKASVIGDKANILNDKSDFFIVSKDPARIDEFEKVYFEDDRMERLAKVGELLGYPKCCSGKYLEEIYNKDPETRIRDLYFQVAAESESFSPFNNSIFCFYGRGNHDVVQKMSLMLTKNDPKTFMGLGQLFLISHAPCSFDCAESEDYAKKVHGLIAETDPDRAAEMMRIFAKPVLFFNMFEFIVLDGEASRDRASYRGVHPPFSLVDDTILEKVKDGDELVVHDDRIEIMKEGSKVHTIVKKVKQDGFLIPFKEKKI